MSDTLSQYVLMPGGGRIEPKGRGFILRNGARMVSRFSMPTNSIRFIANPLRPDNSWLSVGACWGGSEADLSPAASTEEIEFEKSWKGWCFLVGNPSGEIKFGILGRMTNSSPESVPRNYKFDTMAGIHIQWLPRTCSIEIISEHKPRIYQSFSDRNLFTPSYTRLTFHVAPDAEWEIQSAFEL